MKVCEVYSTIQIYQWKDKEAKKIPNYIEREMQRITTQVSHEVSNILHVIVDVVDFLFI